MRNRGSPSACSVQTAGAARPSQTHARSLSSAAPFLWQFINNVKTSTAMVIHLPRFHVLKERSEMNYSYGCICGECKWRISSSLLVSTWDFKGFLSTVGTDQWTAWTWWLSHGRGAPHKPGGPVCLCPGSQVHQHATAILGARESHSCYEQLC